MNLPNWSLEHLLRRERFPGPVWEPIGENVMIETALLAHKYKVTVSEHFEDWDFLNQPMPHNGGVKLRSIVTAPPDTRTIDFVTRALGHYHVAKVAMFAKLSLVRHLEDTPLTGIYAHSHGPGAYAWFVFDHTKHKTRKPQVEWLP